MAEFKGWGYDSSGLFPLYEFTEEEQKEIECLMKGINPKLEMLRENILKKWTVLLESKEGGE